MTVIANYVINKCLITTIELRLMCLLIEHFCCQNPDCPDSGLRNQGNLRYEGYSGKKKQIRMIRCKTCMIRFSERKGTPLEHCRLPKAKALSVLNHLREGCGTRSTGRLVGVSTNAVTRLARKAGSHAKASHAEHVAFSPSNPGSAVG